MKKNKFLIIAALVLTTISACKKLTETTYSVLSNFSTESDIKAASLGVYQAFFQNDWPSTCSFLAMHEVGHKYSTYGSFGDGYFNDPYYDYKLNSQEGTLSSNWNMLYTMINRANEVIEAAPQSVKEPKAANLYVAEGKFLRAWAYFELVQLWGDVPLHLQATKSLADRGSVYKTRSSKDSVYAAIVSDLQFAGDNLPNTWDVGDLGRVTRASAMGLLGKVYLTMAGKQLNKPENYQNAVNVIEKMETMVQADSFNVSLQNTYKNIFDTHNEMNSEILFAFRGSANTTSQKDGTIWSWLWVSTGMCPVTNGNFQAHMYGLRWDILRLYDKTDVRTRDGIGGHYDDLQDPLVNGAADTIYYDTIALFRYRRMSDNAVIGGGGQGGGLGYSKMRSYEPWIGYPGGFQKDYFGLRYADVILCYAEALNEVGRTADAITQMNRVRTRSGGTAIPNAMYPASDQVTVRQAVRDERRRELVGEGTTITDIRRWGTLKEEMDAFKQDQFTAGRILPVYDAKYELYPIPFSEISSNGLLTQNPGWN